MTTLNREAFERKYAELYPVACMARDKFKREDFGEQEYEDICVQVAWTMYQALSLPPASQEAIRKAA